MARVEYNSRWLASYPDKDPEQFALAPVLEGTEIPAGASEVFFVVQSAEGMENFSSYMPVLCARTGNGPYSPFLMERTHDNQRTGNIRRDDIADSASRAMMKSDFCRKVKDRAIS